MIHCLFEQSGTFKNAFKKLGYNALDYDIENNFGETDFQIDIFNEIKNFGNTESKENNIFDNMQVGEIVFAFFPCTYFSVQSKLNSRGKGNFQKKWSIDEIYRYCGKLAEKRMEYFNILLSLISICYIKNLKLIVENPSHCNYLNDYLPETYEIIKINDRTKLGDDFRKPTMFLFFNFNPKFTLIENMKKTPTKKISNIKGFERSVINNIFAENFIKNFIEL